MSKEITRRNPIAKALTAGANRFQVIRDKRADILAKQQRKEELDGE